MALIVYCVPVIAVGVLAWLFDIYTDSTLLRRWARDVRSAHAKKAVLYLMTGLLGYFGLGGVGSAVQALGITHTSGSRWVAGMSLGILAELALCTFEWKKRS